MKIDTNKLYVACRVYDYETELEPWIQYESFGKVQHDIFISPKRVLVVKEEKDGKDVYFDYKTSKELYVQDYSSSYTTKSTPWTTVWSSGLPTILGKRIEEYFDMKEREIQFLVPLSEFLKEKFGVEVDSVSPKLVDFILHVINLTSGKPIHLSTDSSIAEEQIATRILKKKDIQ